MKLCGMLAVCVAFSGAVATAQSYDEVLENGTLGRVSTWENKITMMLADAGVPADCINSLSTEDLNYINHILEKRRDSQKKRRRIQGFLENACAMQ